MEQVVPWSALLAVIAPDSPKFGNLGRQPYPMETMLRVQLMQQWNAFSDRAMEEALYDTTCLCQFAHQERQRQARLGDAPGQERQPVILRHAKAHQRGRQHQATPAWPSAGNTTGARSNVVSPSRVRLRRSGQRAG